MKYSIHIEDDEKYLSSFLEGSLLSFIPMRVLNKKKNEKKKNE